MARTAQEIMSSELFALRGSETAGDALRYFLAMGITGAPVLDDGGRPIGFVSLRDAVRADAEATIDDVMVQPVETITTDAALERVADWMCDHDRHHLVCIDEEGHAVGFVSVLDVLRGLRGRPARHPDAFSRYDRSTGLSWTDPVRFDRGALDDVPSSPGVYTLTVVVPGEEDRVVWSEICADLRHRLEELLTVPRMAPPHIADLMHRNGLQLRFALAPSATALRDALAARGDHAATAGDAAP
jgi:hypothetical protein